MITSEHYTKQFKEYLWLKQNNPEIEDAIDFLKTFDFDKFNVDNTKSQDDIIGEVRAWKKFYLNNYQKQSVRDFEPFLTQGEIADFILNRLNLFNKDGTLQTSSELINNLIQKQLREVRRARSQIEAIRQGGILFNQIKNQLTNKDNINVIEDTFRNFLVKTKASAEAEGVYSVISSMLPKELNNILKKESKKTVVNFLFDMLTDFDVNNAYDFLGKSEIVKTLKRRWMFIVQRDIFDSTKPIQATDVFDLVVDVFSELKDSFEFSKKIFRTQFTELLAKGLSKEIKNTIFNSKLSSIVKLFSRSSFRTGIKYLGLDPDDFKTLENFVVTRVNNNAKKFVIELGQKMLLGSLDIGIALTRATTWANKFLNKMFEFGRLAGDRNGLYEWVFGDTRHCASCLKANGQRHRLKHWHEAGILPQSNGSKELICGGYFCKCKLIKVTGKSRGRLDAIPVR